MRATVLLVVAVAAGASLLGSAAGGTRSAGHRASTRTLKIVYRGSGKAENVQHVDFRPGHGSDPQYDDRYTKNVSWDISWQVTVTDGKITNVSAPVGSVTGRGQADLGSHPDQSCSGLVALPKAQGKRYVPINLQLVDTTEQFITLKMTYASPYTQMIPLYWADVPTCPGAVFSPMYEQHDAGNKAIIAWYKSAEPQFKISLLNGYRITPSRFAHTWVFGPTATTVNQKTLVYQWDSTIAAAGQGSSGSGPPPPASKPKPCTPAPERDAPADIQRYIRDFGKEAETWINDVAAKEIPKDSPSEANETWEIYGVGCRNETAVVLGPPEMFVDPDDLYREKRAIPQGELGLIPPEFSATGGTPNVVIITGDSVASSSRAPSIVGSRSASGRVPRMTVRVTSAGVRALRTGKPLPVTLTAVFKVAGKPPIRATTKIVLQGPRPAARITSVTFGGSVQSPSIVVHGENLGTRPAPNPAGSPANRPLCPGAINGNAGLDYGTSLYLYDTTANWAAGRYRPTANELDCIGLIVTRFTPTEVDYRFGGFYAQVYPKLALAAGDAVEVDVNGATRTVHVKYGATVTG